MPDEADTYHEVSKVAVIDKEGYNGEKPEKSESAKEDTKKEEVDNEINNNT